MSSDTSNHVKVIMGGKLSPEGNAKGGKPAKPAKEAKPEAPAPATVAEAPVALTPPPAPPAPVAEAPKEAIPTDPLDVPFVLNAGLALATGVIPEATRKATSQVNLPPQVVGKAKGILNKANATPEAIAEAIVAYADAAAGVLDLASGDVFLMALEQGLEREHKEGIASAKAKRAQEEAIRRAKVRTDLQAAVEGKGEMALTISDLPPKLIAILNAAQKEGLFISLHGPINPDLPADKQVQGSGIFVRDKGTATARAPKAPGEGGESTEATFQYFDDSKGGILVTGSLTKYFGETYPGSDTVKVMTDLEARRNAGETKSRISPWDAYRKGKEAGDTFVIRQVKVDKPAVTPAVTPAPAPAQVK